MPADPHRRLLRHTGTNHVRHGGPPEIVEQKAGPSNGLDRLPPRAPEVTHRLAFTVKHSITDTRAIWTTDKACLPTRLYQCGQGGRERQLTRLTVLRPFSRGADTAPCPVHLRPRQPEHFSPAPPRQIPERHRIINGIRQLSQEGSIVLGTDEPLPHVVLSVEVDRGTAVRTDERRT